MKVEELAQKINELTLKVQQLEEELSDLKNSEFGTGIYLDGCSDAVKEYISGKPVGQKAGE